MFIYQISTCPRATWQGRVKCRCLVTVPVVPTQEAIPEECWSLKNKYFPFHIPKRHPLPGLTPKYSKHILNLSRSLSPSHYIPPRHLYLIKGVLGKSQIWWVHSLSLSTQAILLPVSGNPEIKIYLDIKERVVRYSKSSTVRNPKWVRYSDHQLFRSFEYLTCLVFRVPLYWSYNLDTKQVWHRNTVGHCADNL